MITEGTTAELTTEGGEALLVMFKEGVWFWRANPPNSAGVEPVPADVAGWLSRCVREEEVRSSFMGLRFISHSVPLVNIKGDLLTDLLEQRQKDVDAGKIQPAKETLEDVPPFMRKPADSESLAGQATKRFDVRKSLEKSWLNQVAGTDDPYLLLDIFLLGVAKGVFVYTGKHNEIMAKALIEKSRKVLNNRG